MMHCEVVIVLQDIYLITEIALLHTSGEEYEVTNVNDHGG